jgi:hypothetical protein
MHRYFSYVLPVAGAMILAQPAYAQEESSSLLAVGQVAPDFTIPGATRHGVLRDLISLSDYRGETVVLSFFFRARTGG